MKPHGPVGDQQMQKMYGAKFAAVTMTKDETIRLQAKEIERLRSELSKWKARAQVMREWMDCEQIDVVGAPYAWYVFVNDKPEAARWFDENGVPRD